ncbi:hypothetical protein GH983_22010 (plasmid) [Agrobacterium sp. MA01]|uniref:hypothetical protein n=1 Tax=Agrobacterium sp. MA01 TaxID=2664893 RepID=UPI00129A0EE7|nr:hypothetical protein [Agrobacterium sp. MA01]QGG93234.1 hypothetical protein GH983_22010 [Agrobacterium sp. MA01]
MLPDPDKDARKRGEQKPIRKAGYKLSGEGFRKGFSQGGQGRGYKTRSAPVAQLETALPRESDEGSGEQDANRYIDEQQKTGVWHDMTPNVKDD